MDSGRRGYGRVFFGTFFFKYDILFSMSYRCMQTQTGIYYIYIYILYIVYLRLTINYLGFVYIYTNIYYIYILIQLYV